MSGVATNLGEYHGHKPSHHASNISGINLMSFNEDRSLITEASVFRKPLTHSIKASTHGRTHNSRDGGTKEGQPWGNRVLKDYDMLTHFNNNIINHTRFQSGDTLAACI
jgi:hypothetical protein